MKTTVTVIEDDPHISFGLEEVLRADGFEVSTCKTGTDAVAAVAKHKPELIILDVMLPGMSGYDICKQLRAKGCTAAILMLTAKGQELDKVIGLELGADDYVTKPFSVRELIARVHALLRRSKGPKATAGDQCFKIGNAEIDPKKFQLRRGREVHELTAKELKLLQLFSSSPDE